MLKEKLQADMKEAMKSGDAVKRLVLSLVNSAIKNRELQKRAKSGKAEELNDEEVLEVIASEAKKRKESIESYEKAGREELAQKERTELGILMGYMPEQMSEDEVRAEVKKAISQISASGQKDMGKVIGTVMAKVKGKTDGQMVNLLVKEELLKTAI